MNVAVTGAGGLLGRAVTELALTRGHEVIALDRAPAPGALPARMRWHRADLADYDALRDALAGAAALVHLAAYVAPQVAPEPQVHNNNVVASYNALAAAQAVGITRVCLASSVNAIGGFYSAQPRYDYFPVDERHPCYAEDGYSISKWAAEQQAGAFARRVPGFSVACLRLHALRSRQEMAQRQQQRPDSGSKDLWGYSPVRPAAQACLAAVETDLGGCEVFYVVAPETYSSQPSLGLREQYFPGVEVRGDLSGHRSFYDSAKAQQAQQWSAA
jgi:nucleoside-diphosphate-sugar epimerase